MTKAIRQCLKPVLKASRGGDLVLSLDANTSHSHCFKRVGNCLTVTRFVLASVSTNTLSPVIYLAIRNVAQSNGTLSAIYISVCCDYEDGDLNRLTTGKIAGFDFGLKRYLTGHNGHDIESPQFFKRSINAVKRANRNHCRKQKRSRNRERARLDLARKHRKIANQREDFHWKLAHQLTDEYDEIRLEDLNLQGMKVLWGRKVSDLGFADFVVKLKYIASRKGVKLKFIDKWYPSSKTCSACGTVNETLNLRDRTWQCCNCGAIHDRDRNAAINIYRVGASTLEGEDIKDVSLCQGVSGITTSEKPVNGSAQTCFESDFWVIAK